MFIKYDIENYKKMIIEIIEHIKNLHNKCLTFSSNNIRDNYGKISTSIERKQNEFQDAIETIDENIKSLEECKNLLKEINNELDNFFVDINNKKIETLQAYVMQIIKQNPHLEMDEFHKTVFQFYEELSEINLV